MEPRQRPLSLYGAASDLAPLPWTWVEEQLTVAGTYWVAPPTSGYPHPRPVWGIWSDRRLYLSIGSPAVLRGLGQQSAVTVHLDSGTDVVLVEGTAIPSLPGATTSSLINIYNAKYDWDYQVDRYGELLPIDPVKVMAWRSAGWAGREGFRATGCWVFDAPD